MPYSTRHRQWKPLQQEALEPLLTFINRGLAFIGFRTNGLWFIIVVSQLPSLYSVSTVCMSLLLMLANKVLKIAFTVRFYSLCTSLLGSISLLFAKSMYTSHDLYSTGSRFQLRSEIKHPERLGKVWSTLVYFWVQSEFLPHPQTSSPWLAKLVVPEK